MDSTLKVSWPSEKEYPGWRKHRKVPQEWDRMAQHAILRFEKHKGNPAKPLETHHERQKEQYVSNPVIGMPVYLRRNRWCLWTFNRALGFWISSGYSGIHNSGFSGSHGAIIHQNHPETVRRLIYTTNAIEGFNRQLRKVTKSKTVFISNENLLKMLYLTIMDITKKWTGHRQDWG